VYVRSKRGPHLLLVSSIGMTTPGHDLDRHRRLRVIPRTRDPRIRSQGRSQGERTILCFGTSHVSPLSPATGVFSLRQLSEVLRSFWADQEGQQRVDSSLTRSIQRLFRRAESGCCQNGGNAQDSVVNKSDATLVALMPKTAVGRKSRLLEGKPPSAYVERPLVFEASVTKNGCDSSAFPQQARPQELRCRADIGRRGIADVKSFPNRKLAAPVLSTCGTRTNLAPSPSIIRARASRFRPTSWR
jgi:hypothetical protein